MSSQAGSTSYSERRHSISGKQVRCIGRYLLTGKTLGKGNFARVELATHTITHAKVAIKLIEIEKIKEEYVKRNLLREAQIMKKIHHPNIICLYETMKTNALYCLVTEVAEGGELLAHVRNDYAEKRLSEPQARSFIRQLVSAIHHLHSEGVVHRDLKMENILLDRKKRNIKIVDFGLSNRHQPGELLATHCGSPEYAAPELFVPGQNYGPEVDVWSLGVNMFAMLCGKLPFRGPREGPKKRQKLLEQIAAGINDSHELEMAHLSPACANLIRQLLEVNASHRITLLEVMDHPWITKHGLYLLHPYRPLPHDHEAHRKIIQLMSSHLDLTKQQIEDAISANNCDWIAAIFHLLNDQPEGRTYMSQTTERSNGQPVESSLPVSSQAPLQMETTIMRQDSNENENETVKEQRYARQTSLSHQCSRHPDAVPPIAGSQYSVSSRRNIPPPVTVPTKLPLTSSKTKPCRHMSMSEGSRRLPPTPDSVSAARQQAGLQRSLRRYASSPNTRTDQQLPHKDIAVGPVNFSYRGVDADNQISFDRMTVYDRASIRDSQLKISRGHKDVSLLNGEPPSKRYGWAIPTDSAYTVPMRRQGSGETVQKPAARPSLFHSPGKAPADIASLMAFPSPGTISHRDDGITSSSCNGSTPRSPISSFQSNRLHSPDDRIRTLHIVATQRQRPQTMAAQREMSQPERHRQLPSIETIPTSQMVDLPDHAPSTSHSKRSISGILGRAFKFKHSKKGNKM